MLYLIYAESDMGNTNNGGYVNMRNIRSLIKDDDAMAGGLTFIGVGCVASALGCLEMWRVLATSLCYPIISSMCGASIRNILSGASTLLANCLTA